MVERRIPLQTRPVKENRPQGIGSWGRRPSFSTYLSQERIGRRGRGFASSNSLDPRSDALGSSRSAPLQPIVWGSMEQSGSAIDEGIADEMRPPL